MKTVAKVFLIIDMVLGFWLIFPLVIGLIAIKKMDDNTVTHDEYLLWSILAMILVSLIGGIFMLLGENSQD